MTAKEYLTERNRMSERKDAFNMIDLYNAERNDPGQAITIVSEWYAAHPRKTYKDDFLEKFPKAPVCNNGTPKACKKYIYRTNCANTKKCTDCWNEPME